MEAKIKGVQSRKKVRFKTYVVNYPSALFYSWKSYLMLVQSLVPSYVHSNLLIPTYHIEFDVGKYNSLIKTV